MIKRGWYNHYKLKTEQKFSEKWPRIRVRGRRSFIWRYGVFAWGWGMAFAIWIALGVWNLFSPLVRSVAEYMVLLIILIVIFSVGGVLAGIVMWNVYNEKYK